MRAADSRIVPITLDVTCITDIVSAAQRCQDTTILINNAGVLHDSPMLAADAESAARAKMETNGHLFEGKSRWSNRVVHRVRT